MSEGQGERGADAGQACPHAKQDHQVGEGEAVDMGKSHAKLRPGCCALWNSAPEIGLS